MNYRFKQFMLLAGDILFFYLSLYLALWLRYLKTPDNVNWQAHFFPFSLMFIGWFLIFYISGLYELNEAANTPRFYRKAAQSLAIAAILSVAFFYITPGIGISPKRNLFLFIVIYGFLFLFWRRSYNWILKSQLPKTNVAFIGATNLAAEIATMLFAKPHLGYEVKFLIKTNGEETFSFAGDEKLKILPAENLNQIKELAARDKISAFIFSTNLHHSDELRAALFDCLPLNIKFLNLANFYEQLTGKVPIEVIDQMWFLENLSEGRRRGFDLFKRVYDIFLAIIILIASVVFWPFIGLIIRLESRGPVFIRMPRCGRGGTPFKMLKFRTMREEDNNRAPTQVNDPRITRFGAFLRKTRIDEVPQVLNILRGEMSFVGPRPERPELAAELEKQIPFYRERMLVKPGLTGPDQISGEYHSPSCDDSLKKLQFDLFYVKNRSAYLDLSIILKTIATVISREGR